MSKSACIEQPALTKPPFLTPGDITPEVLCTWEMGCQQYFKHKDIPIEEQVGKVAWRMQEPSIQEWYLTDQDRMDDLTFDEYMAEVHAYWLPLDWADTRADTMCQKLLLSCQGNKLFSEWAVEVQGLNVLLCGTPSHLTELNLRYHLKAHMHPDLQTKYCSELVAALTDFRAWIEKIWLLDKKRLRTIAKQKEAVEATLHAKHLHNGGDKELSSSSQYNAKARWNTRDARTTTFIRVPALTDEECMLLQVNNGCFKCW